MGRFERMAVSTYALLDRGLAEAVRHLVREGWKAVEVMGEGRHGELLDWTDGQVEELAALKREQGIEWTIHAPITGCNPAAAEVRARDASMELLLRTLRIADKLACPYVVLHPGERASGSGGFGPASAETAEEAERVEGFLREALQATRGSNVVIALENVPPYPGLLGVEASFLKELADRLADPRIGICYDVGHAHMTGSCLEGLKLLLPYVAALHLSDNHGQRDEHLALGAGTVPLAEVRALVGRSGGGAVLPVLEMARPDGLNASKAWLERIGGENCLDS